MTSRPPHRTGIDAHARTTRSRGSDAYDAAWAAILAVPTALAGIYGMNFNNMPELSTRWGYPTVVLGMAAICSVLYWRFRKNGWL